MDRLITAANFVHANMPQGADYLNPVLSRLTHGMLRLSLCHNRGRTKKVLENDFPDLALKPVDTPYGPYLDNFSVEQHKYRPFEPIRVALARLKRKD
jgi:thiosulfate dehydrogenase